MIYRNGFLISMIGEKFEFDVIIFATGFVVVSITGSGLPCVNVF